MAHYDPATIQESDKVQEQDTDLQLPGRMSYSR